MHWDTQRKILYALIISIVALSLSLFLFHDVLFPEPTCVDKKKNGYELGVDCGGACALRCTQEVNPLTVVWAKAVPAGKGVYDFVALVSNKNIDNASRELGYTFTVYDSKGQVSGILSGSTTAPLDGSFPLIIQNVPLTTTPTSVTATLSDGPHYTVLESPSSPTIKVLERHYEAGAIPRVYATIMNTKHLEINNLPIRVLLFDEQNNVYAVGQTFIPTLPKEGVQQISITWKEPLPVAPTKINIYPIFNPFDAIAY